MLKLTKDIPDILDEIFKKLDPRGKESVRVNLSSNEGKETANYHSEVRVMIARERLKISTVASTFSDSDDEHL